MSIKKQKKQEEQRILSWCIKNLNYDAETGKFFSVRLKREVGSLELSNGYIKLYCMGANKYAHRIAWLMHHGFMPPNQIDHINGIKTDNRICNLRLATCSQNVANVGVRKSSSTNVTGVAFFTPIQKWQAYIDFNRKRTHLGYFSSIEDAIAARINAEFMHGDFAFKNKEQKE